MNRCVCKKGVFTGSSHKVVNSEGFFACSLVKNILLLIPLMDISGAGIGLEEAML